MSEDRTRILKMVAEGKISVQEAEELFEAMGEGVGSENSTSSDTEEKTRPAKKLKYLRVVVKSGDGDDVNIKVPLALLRAGIKLSSVMPKGVSEKVNVHLADHGLDIDLNDLKNGNIEQIIESLGDMEVTVDSSDGDKVRIFCE